MIKLVIVGMSMLFLSACSLVPAAVERAEKISDDTLAAKLYSLCNITPSGALRRRASGNLQFVEGYNLICNPQVSNLRRLLKP